MSNEISPAKPGRSARTTALLMLCAAGVWNAAYMLAYHLRLIDRIWCPLLGDGCAIVARSRQARHFGVPNAAVGIAGYVTLGALASARRPSPARRRVLALGAAASFAASLLLLWEQAAKVRRWCFWCVNAAVINAAIFFLSLRQHHR